MGGVFVGRLDDLTVTYDICEVPRISFLGELEVDGLLRPQALVNL